MDRIYRNGDLVDGLRWALATLRRGSESFPSALRAVLEERAWKGPRYDPKTKTELPGSETLEDFIVAPPLEGLGASVEELESLCDEDTKEVLRAAVADELDERAAMLEEAIHIATTAFSDLRVSEQEQAYDVMKIVFEFSDRNRKMFLDWARIHVLRSRSISKYKEVVGKAGEGGDVRGTMYEVEVKVPSTNGRSITKKAKISKTSSLAPEDAQAVIYGYLEGMSMTRLSKQYGAAVTAIRKLIKDVGVRPPVRVKGSHKPD